MTGGYPTEMTAPWLPVRRCRASYMARSAPPIAYSRRCRGSGLDDHISGGFRSDRFGDGDYCRLGG